MLPFFCARNLVQKDLTESTPWSFAPNSEELARLRGLKKEVRRQWMLTPDAHWNCYTPLRGMARNLRISNTNPPVGMRGLVLDFDAETDFPMIEKRVKELPEAFRPQYLELSLSRKCRIVWPFEKELLIPSSAFAAELIKAFIDKMGVRNLLAGYDAASEKPSEMWTNGGEWFELEGSPLSNTVCMGIYADVSKRHKGFSVADVPLEAVKAEMELRFPGRWVGEFALDQLGVRFWDETADNTTGAQVKPDGMLCFTGTQPFMYWSDIFGRAWVDEQRVVNLGKAVEGIYFDNKQYWECVAGRWMPLQRPDVQLLLKNRGLSDKKAKGANVSDLERTLRAVQETGRIDGAAPLINYRPGLVEFQGRKILNTCTLNLPTCPDDATGDPSQFPFIWSLLNTMFALPEAKDYYVAWAARYVWSIHNYVPTTGQAVFLCGPANNGKTLMLQKIIAPLVGNKYASPLEFFMGRSTFTDHLFEATLLVSNDDSPASNESEKVKFASSVKSFVVNPTQNYHPKFCQQIMIPWNGRYMSSLNDDAVSVGFLPEVNSNTADKMMFFRTKAREGKWPEKAELEGILERELPYFLKYLLIYEAPEHVKSYDRCGVVSYFDPKLRELAHQQVYAYNLHELIGAWMNSESEFDTPGKSIEVSPTDLLTRLSINPNLVSISKEWTVSKIAKSLTSLAKQKVEGVEFVGDGNRLFKLTKTNKK